MVNKVDTIFTSQVKSLIDKLYGRSVLKDSLLERAQQFYENQPFNESKLDKLQNRIAELSTEKENEKARKQIDKIERDLRNFKQEIKEESDERCQFYEPFVPIFLSLLKALPLLNPAVNQQNF